MRGTAVRLTVPQVDWQEERCTLTLEGEPVLKYVLSWPQVRGGGLGGRWISRYYDWLARAWRLRWQREVYWKACIQLADRRAAARRPAFDQRVRDCLEELHRLEREGSPSLDRTADTFARILCAAAPASGDEAADRAMEQLLYHVGRWIYLVDAWDDLEEDRGSGEYNPYLARFPDDPEGHREEVRLTLRHSLNLAVSACNLTDFGPWSGLLLNILCLGLPTVEEAVFTGAWRQLKKQTGRNRHERSI